MKKFATILICVLVAKITLAQSVQESLNGYLIGDVPNMVLPFQTVNTQPPQNTSVWFDKTTINNMIQLLLQERKQRVAAHLSLTDGIRIYFAYNNLNKPTIVIVSTYDTGKSNPDANDDYHADYYEHSANADLFTTKNSINGLPCYDDCGGGALLYDTCTNCTDDKNCDSKNPHYLKRSQCEGMVRKFALKKSNINTTAEWFDLDMIAAFAKESSKISNYDGVRIYYARHPDKDPYYPGRDSFVVVTTQSTSDASIHKDYFNCSVASAYFDRFKNGEKFHENGQDKGELCPYNCNLP